MFRSGMVPGSALEGGRGGFTPEGRAAEHTAPPLPGLADNGEYDPPMLSPAKVQGACGVYPASCQALAEGCMSTEASCCEAPSGHRWKLSSSRARNEGGP